MKRTMMAVLAMAMIAVGTSRLEAVSTPVIQGFVSGIELCPQDWCGVAIFAGIYQGQVANNPNAFGFMVIAVKHDPLPVNQGDVAAITGGAWELTVGFKRIRGGASGFLIKDAGNTYTVHTALPIAPGSGFSGSLAFDGTLDHTVFPPGIFGVLGQ